MMPAKLRVPVLEPNIHRQVVGMSVGLLYRADVPFPFTFPAVEQAHQRANAGFVRLQKNHFLQ